MKFKFLCKAIRLKLIYLSVEKMGLKCVGGHFIAPGNLDEDSLVLDLGGNRGNFSHAIVNAFGATIYCVEANPVLAAALPKRNKIIIINCALTDYDGEIDFSISNNDEASSINSAIADVWKIRSQIKVKAKTLLSLCSEYEIENFDLVKMDIEGAEIPVLNSIPDEILIRIPQLTVEFHEFLDLKLTIPTYEILERLQRIGFRLIVTSTEKFSEVLFLNSRSIKFNSSQYFWYFVHTLVRYRS